MGPRIQTQLNCQLTLIEPAKTWITYTSVLHPTETRTNAAYYFS